MEDGYFKTGDSGYLKDGELFLKERIKDLYKTSNGKYIAPQMIDLRCRKRLLRLSYFS